MINGTLGEGDQGLGGSTWPPDLSEQQIGMWHSQCARMVLDEPASWEKDEQTYRNGCAKNALVVESRVEKKQNLFR